MKLRVRVLHGEVDPAAVKEVYQSLPASQRGGHGRLVPLEVEVPMAVTARDFDDDLEGLSARLRAGTVRTTDLVNDGTGWSTIGDFPPLGDVVGQLPRHLLPPAEERAIWKRQLMLVALVVLGLGALGLIAALLSR